VKPEIFDQLDKYIKKFYINLLIKRTLLFLATAGVLYLLVNFVEDKFYLGRIFRLIIVILFGIFTKLMGYWAFMGPALKIFWTKKRMSYKDAETLLKSSIPELKDHLRNLLELYEKAQNRGESENLILQAAIEQKISSLKFYNFVSTIDFRKNLKFARWALLPAGIILALLIFRPHSLSHPTHRLVRPHIHFEKPSPFAFEILNPELLILQNGDFELKIKSVGDQIPDEVWLQMGENTFKMNKLNRLEFNYWFRNVNQSFKFAFKVADFRTIDYTLNVLPRPTIFDFRAFLTYPRHTGLTDETIENNGDFRVPEGTQIRFQIRMRDVDDLEFFIKNHLFTPILNDGSTAIFAVRAIESFDYMIIPKNRHVLESDTLRYTVTTVRDQFPTISVHEFRDSATPTMVYFRGLISDDFGFSNLKMVIVVTSETQDTIEQNLFFNPQQAQQDFMHFVDFEKLLTTLGDKAEYYFEVWDNDGVNGPKSARSTTFVFSTKTEKELALEINRQGDEIAKNIQENIRMLQKNQRDLNELTKKMLEKPNITWEERKLFEQIMQDQNRLKRESENLQNQLESMFQNEQKLSPDEERLLQKQRELNELFSQLFSEEMKKTLEEIQKLMQQQMSREDLEKAMDQIKMNNAELEKMLDQNLEIFKQMEVDRKFDMALDQLQNLREQQQQLREDIAENNISQEDALQKQNEINEEFSDIQKALDDAEKANQELQRPNDVQRNTDLEKKISENLQKASESLSKQQNRNAQSSQPQLEEQARRSQSQAEQGMEDMQNELEQQLSDSDDEDDAEDMAMIRRLLNNILKTSFNQEEVMEVLRSIRINDPKYQDAIRRQSELNRDISTISDSLYALGTRQPIVAVLINNEIKSMNNFSQQALKDLLGMNDVMFLRTGRQNASAISRQQYTMTSLNTMALLLAEALKNMENQMQGSGSCRKTKKNQKGSSCSQGKGNKKTQSAREMQEQLNQQLQRMREQMKTGQPQQRQAGQPSMSEQFARSAAQQEAIRRLMQQAADELKKSDGRAAGELQNLINEMEKAEQDLVNKIFDEQSMRRQEQILTRLLEAERAELNREQEEGRRGTEAQQREQQIPTELLEYHKKRSQESELLQKFHPTLRPYYQQKTQEYFRQTP
jgi:sulfur carrier protein ThiS